MDPLVIAAMLAASLLHATWHAMVKSSGDQVVALAGMNIVSGSIAIALLPVAGFISAPALAVVLGSVLLHVGYKIALARLYTFADLGQAYPLARGLTPLIAAALAFAFLDEMPAPSALAGLGFVSIGVLALGFERQERSVPIPTLAAAIAASTMVAAYSVVDAFGVRLAGDWFAFTAWLIAADSCVFVGYAVVTRGKPVVQAWRAGWQRVIVSGGLGTASFGVFMWALGQAPVGPVSALRETSVVFAALLGTFVLGERGGAVRYAGVLTVMAGVGAIAMARQP